MSATSRSVLGVLFVVGASAAFQLAPGLWGMDIGASAQWATAGWILAPAVAALLCFAASLYSSGTDRQAWGSLAAGCMLWAAGTVLWSFDADFPGPGDAAYLSACLFFVAGIFRYTVGSRVIGWVKLCDFAIAASAVSLALLIVFHGHLEDSPLSGFAQAVAFLYPVCWFAVAAFGLTCLALHTSPWRRPITRLLVVGATLHATADLFYGLSELDDSYAVGMEYDALWVASFLTLSWAAIEHVIRLRSADGVVVMERRWPVEALVPAVAVGIVALSWLVTEDRIGPMFVVSGTAAMVLPLLIGVREHLVLKGERQLKAIADASREELSAVLESTGLSGILCARP